MQHSCFGLLFTTYIPVRRPHRASIVHCPSPSYRLVYRTNRKRATLVLASAKNPKFIAGVVFTAEVVQNYSSAAARRIRDPGVLALVIFALLVGWVVGRRRRWGKWMKLKSARTGNEVEHEEMYYGRRNDVGVGGSFESGQRFLKEAEDDGENSLWLNASLRSTWTLFRKSTSSLVANVLQPSLDGMELPDSIERIEIASLRMGDRPPLVRKIRRLPCRALAEIQYSFNARLVSDTSTIIDLLVHTKLPVVGGSLAVPVRVSSLDINAKTWVAARLIPYPPYIQSAQWSLLKLPRVKINLRVAKILPISTIPILSAILTRVLTKVLPRQFLFPKFQAINLHNNGASIQRFRLKSETQRSIESLRREYPELWKVFESIDLDDDGRLTPAEVSAGLTAWGYSSFGDRKTVFSLLDTDRDNKIDFFEFANTWPKLQDSLVPRRYTGVIGGVIQKATSLPSPIIGFANPYAVFTMGTQSVTTRRDRDSGRSGRRGEATWMESWEILVEDETTEVLTIEVRDASWLAIYPPFSPPVQKLPSIPAADDKQLTVTERGVRQQLSGPVLGRAAVPVASLVGKGLQRLVLDFTEGQGSIRIDLVYMKYVDPTTAVVHE